MAGTCSSLGGADTWSTDVSCSSGRPSLWCAVSSIQALIACDFRSRGGIIGFAFLAASSLWSSAGSPLSFCLCDTVAEIGRPFGTLTSGLVTSSSLVCDPAFCLLVPGCSYWGRILLPLAVLFQPGLLGCPKLWYLGPGFVRLVWLCQFLPPMR